MKYGKGRLWSLVGGGALLAALVACSGPVPASIGNDGGDGGGDGNNRLVEGQGTSVTFPSPDIGAPDSFPAVDPAGYPQSGGAERIAAPSMAPDYAYGYDYGYGYTTPAYYPSPVNLPPAGIHVIGSGAVKVSPDVAILSAGVESRADDVEAARSRAAQAMDAVLEALRAQGVQEQDIQTQHFSISPEYTWRELVDRETGYRHGEQVLLGYRVTNHIQVKVRDLDSVGEVIDAIADAGGNTIRVHHVSFTIEDPRPVEAQARELAVREARAKAEQMATWAGESLGKLVYLVETSAPSPARFDMAVPEAKAGDASMPPTPIVPGDLEVRVVVQGVWDVQ